MSVHDRFTEKWEAHACADCNPESDSPGDECGYEEPYVLLVPEGECWPDLCPRCGGYLSFTDWAKGLEITNTPAQRWAAKRAEEVAE